LVFLTGLPLFTAQHILYAAACWLVVRALRPLVPSPWLRTVLFAALLFNPVTFDGIRTMRVARQDLLPALSLIIVACFLALYARSGGARRSLVRWAALAGVALPVFWMDREEGIWLVPCILLLWIAAAGRILRQRLQDRPARLAITALPAVGWAAGLCLVAGINFFHYGLFTTCEFRRQEFQSACGALIRVTPSPFRPGIAVARETRERIYAVSPAFAELRGYLEGPGGEGWAAASGVVTHLPASEHEFAAGWFVWALRDAVVAAGHGGSGPDAMAYYARLAREVNAACDSGRLKAGSRRSGIQPPLRWADLPQLLDATRRAARLAFLFKDIDVHTPPSIGTPRELILFADLTRGRLSPTPEGEHIYPKQRWLDGVRVKILEKVAAAYAWCAPFLAGSGLIALIASMIVAAQRRVFPYFAFAGAAMLASIAAMVAICAIIDVTSFPAVDIAYLTGCPGMALLAAFSGWLALAEALGRRKLQVADPSHPAN
jgi:hypothetical protein